MCDFIICKILSSGKWSTEGVKVFVGSTYSNQLVWSPPNIPYHTLMNPLCHNGLPYLSLIHVFSLTVGWHAQSDWPAVDGQAPGRVAIRPILPVRFVEGPQWSVLQTSSPHLWPGQETFLFFQKELSPAGLVLSTADRQETDKATEKEGVTSRYRGNNAAKDWQWHTHWGLVGVALYLSHFSLLTD